MNWFSLIKESMPLVEDPHKYKYFDIGHSKYLDERRFNKIKEKDLKEELWYIHSDGSFVTEIANANSQHDFRDCLSHGRYSLKNGEVPK